MYVVLVQSANYTNDMLYTGHSSLVEGSYKGSSSVKSLLATNSSIEIEFVERNDATASYVQANFIDSGSIESTSVENAYVDSPSADNPSASNASAEDAFINNPINIPCAEIVVVDANKAKENKANNANENEDATMDSEATLFDWERRSN